MKSFEEQILELSKLVESGRLSQPEFEELKADLEEKEALRIRYAPKVSKYSAESDLPLTRVPMEPAKNIPRAEYRTENKSGIFEGKNFNDIMIFSGIKILSSVTWVYIICYLFGVLLLLAILFGYEPSTTAKYFSDKPSAAEIAMETEKRDKANKELTSYFLESSRLRALVEKETPEEAEKREKRLIDYGSGVPGK